LAAPRETRTDQARPSSSLLSGRSIGEMRRDPVIGGLISLILAPLAEASGLKLHDTRHIVLDGPVFEGIPCRPFAIIASTRACKI